MKFWKLIFSKLCFDLYIYSDFVTCRFRHSRSSGPVASERLEQSVEEQGLADRSLAEEASLESLESLAIRSPSRARASPPGDPRGSASSDPAAAPQAAPSQGAQRVHQDPLRSSAHPPSPSHRLREVPRARDRGQARASRTRLGMKLIILSTIEKFELSSSRKCRYNVRASKLLYTPRVYNVFQCSPQVSAQLRNSIRDPRYNSKFHEKARRSRGRRKSSASFPLRIPSRHANHREQVFFSLTEAPRAIHRRNPEDEDDDEDDEDDDDDDEDRSATAAAAAEAAAGDDGSYRNGDSQSALAVNVNDSASKRKLVDVKSKKSFFKKHRRKLSLLFIALLIGALTIACLTLGAMYPTTNITRIRLFTLRVPYRRYVCGRWPEVHPSLDLSQEHSWFKERSVRLSRRILDLMVQNFTELKSDVPWPVHEAQLLFASCLDVQAQYKLGLKPLFDLLAELKLPRVPAAIKPRQKGDEDDDDYNDDFVKQMARVKRMLWSDAFFGLQVYADPRDNRQKLLAFDLPDRDTPFPSDKILEKRLRQVRERARRRFLINDDEQQAGQGEEAEDDKTRARGMSGNEAFSASEKLYMAEVLKQIISNGTSESATCKTRHEFDIVPEAEITDLVDRVFNLSGVFYKLYTKYTNASSSSSDSSEEPEEVDDEDYMLLDELQRLTDDYVRSVNESIVPRPLWRPFVEELLRGLEIDFDPAQQKVYVGDLEFLQEIALVLSSTDKQILETAVWWMVVDYCVPHTSEELRKIWNLYVNDVTGLGQDHRGWSVYCTDTVNELMGMAVAWLVVEPAFARDGSRDRVAEMLDNIKRAFMDFVLEDIEWMDGPTKVATLEKNRKMKSLIGFPDWLFEDGRLDEYYDGINITEDAYFNNMLQIIRVRNINGLMDLAENGTADDDDDDDAGALNYGAIGSILGHELTHGFDNSGRRFDSSGNLKQWWSNETIARYTDRAACFVEQYDKYYLPEVDEYIDGELTLGENIADNGGLREAYKAYQLWKSKHGDEPLLPGFSNFTHEQLLFMSYAHMWCESYTSYALVWMLQDSHCPGHVRLQQALRNSEHFSRAFSCPVGSPMNPKKKCQLCDNCGKKLGNKRSLLMHAKTVHEGCKDFAHNSIQEGRKDYACDKCKKKFGSKLNLIRHQKTVHEGRKYYACDKCEKIFGRKQHLLQHQRAVHEGLKNFACDSFELEGVHEYVVLCDNEECMRMGECTRPVSSNSTSAIRACRKDYTCDKCEKKFGRKLDLIRHQKTVHEGRKDYACDKCKKIFGHKPHLLQHQRAVHEGRKDFAYYLCEKCAKRFGHKPHLLQHQRAVHEGRKDFACDRCEKKFTEKKSLTVHIKTVHEHRKDFTCDRCEKKFGTKSNLFLHQKRVHYRRKDYSCDNCERKCASKSDLLKHQRMVHEGPKDYVCQKCEKKFGQKSDLSKHQKIVHEGRKDYASKNVSKISKANVENVLTISFGRATISFLANSNFQLCVPTELISIFIYVCGRWPESHPIHDGYQSQNWLLERQTRLLRRIPDLMAQNFTERIPEVPRAVKEAQILYFSCLDVRAQYKLGLGPLFGLLAELGLPRVPRQIISGPHGGNDDFVEQMARVKRLLWSDMFFGLEVYADPRDNRRKLLVLGLPDRDTPFPRDKSVLEEGDLTRSSKSSSDAYSAMEKLYLVELLKHIVGNGTSDSIYSCKSPKKFDNSTMAKMTDLVDQVVNFTGVMKKINSRYANKSINFSEEPEEVDDADYMLLDELQRLTDDHVRSVNVSIVPRPLWRPFVEELLRGLEVDFDPAQQKVYVDNLEFLQEIALVLSSTDEQLLETMVWWRVVEHCVQHTSWGLRRIWNIFFKDETGLGQREARSIHCSESVNELMGMAVAWLFVEPTFSPDHVAEMLENIKRAFMDFALKDIDWMDEPAKVATLEKIRKMKSRIGFPDWLFEDGRLDEYYEGIDKYVNGKLTLGENIADNGGLRQAYEAYRIWKSKHGDEPLLPGFGNFTHEQLFFLSYAHVKNYVILL
ncbi:unnamed protein product [Trichogramma brassicae]|uniref:C2H2-type domain-containing protein n=1 Tax=Trichogramma brassicae TaxID=86971 RepID=A0A6H5IVD6_9HYME|nr:unnamed protein product [Trichogramma brassicae]